MKSYDFEITKILVSKFFQTTQMSFLIIYTLNIVSYVNSIPIKRIEFYCLFVECSVLYCTVLYCTVQYCWAPATHNIINLDMSC